MKKLKVLVLSHMYPRSTDPIAGIFVHQQVKALLKAGCQVKVISPVPYAPRILWANSRRRAYGQTPRSTLIDDIPVEFPRYIRAPGSWFHSISCYTMYKSVERISSVIKAFAPDILHAHTATPDGYAGLILKKKYRLPLVCSLLGSDINVYPDYRPFGRRVTYRLISEADQLVSVSQALKVAAEAIAQPKHDIQVIYMGVDLEKFVSNDEDRVHIRAALGILPEELVLLFVGGLHEAKGILELIEAFVQLCTQFRNLHLVFVGDGPARGELKRRISEVRLESRVHLVGQKPHEEIPHWLSASDIFVLPSHWEGLPNVVVEAMACKRPVVATCVGGIPEAVEDGEGGILIDKSNVEALVKAIALLLDDEAKRESMGAAGRRIVEKKFTWEKNAEKTNRVYKEVLNAS